MGDYEKAEFLFHAIPFEKTTSFLRGTLKAPEEILKYSDYLEFFDPQEKELFSDLSFYTKFNDEFEDLESIYKYVIKSFDKKKKNIFIGGEHTLTFSIIRALKEFGYNFHFIYFDAHYDLRDSYEGNRFSHASAIRRVFEIIPDITGFGIRAGDIEEYEFYRSKGITVFHSFEIEEKFEEIENHIKKIKKDFIYISFDFDFLDGFCFPSTGTPEPNGSGLRTYLKIVEFIKKSSKKIVGIDFVEFMPIKDRPQYSYFASYVIFKTISKLRRNFKID